MGRKVNHTQQYKAAKAAKVGDVVKCAHCGKEFVKRYYQEVFCCPKCKDDYWNKKGDRHKGGKSYHREYNYKHLERLQRIGYLCDEDGIEYDPVLNEMRDEDFEYCEW